MSAEPEEIKILRKQLEELRIASETAAREAAEKFDRQRLANDLELNRLRIASETAAREAAEKLAESKKEDYLLSKGFFPLGVRNVSQSAPTEGHELDDSFTFLEGDLAILDDEVSKGVGSSIWRSTEDDKLRPWSSENDIQNYVQSAIKDIIHLAGLKEVLDSYTEITLSLVKHLRADIVIFRKEGSVVGVCEVKVPSDKDGTDLESLSLKSQICNYMLQLKYTHGVDNVFGIVTTYKEWKICWLDGAEDLAAATSLPCTRQTVTTESSTEVKAYFSKAFKFNDTELVKALVTTVKKMSSTSIQRPTWGRLVGERDQRKYGLVMGEKFTWSMLPRDNFLLSFKAPSSGARKFYFLQDYHGGRDGRVWLAASTTGNLTVIKLSKSVCYDEEANFWGKIWDVEVQVLKLLDANALRMPFAFHGYQRDNKQPVFRPLEEWVDPSDCSAERIIASAPVSKAGGFDAAIVERYFNDPWSAAKEALEFMAKKGYVHEDLKWAHVALLPSPPSSRNDSSEKWTVRPILIDLHSVRVLRDGETVDAVVDEGLRTLLRKQVQ